MEAITSPSMAMKSSFIRESVLGSHECHWTLAVTVLVVTIDTEASLVSMAIRCAMHMKIYIILLYRNVVQ